jgi:heat-inducible transcriptional repressor
MSESANDMNSKRREVKELPLEDRKKVILKAVVDDYITSAEPVGSKSLASKINLKLSPATLRNEMAELENLGYLEQPHTSAGRIPSNLGYRMYVDELMNAHKLSSKEMETINNTLTRKIRELDFLIAEAGKLISSLTNYAAFATLSQTSGARIRRVDLLPVDRDTFVIVLVFSSNVVKNTVAKKQPEIADDQLHVVTAILNLRLFNRLASDITESLIHEIVTVSGVPESFAKLVVDFICDAASQLDQSRVYVNGATRVLDQPEFRDVIKAQKLLDYLSDSSSIARLPVPEQDTSMKILIGPENVNEELRESSVVVASYDIGDGMHGLIGVVGPTRMDYSKVAARLNYFTGRLNRFLNSENPDDD